MLTFHIRRTKNDSQVRNIRIYLGTIMDVLTSEVQGYNPHPELSVTT